MTHTPGPWVYDKDKHNRMRVFADGWEIVRALSTHGSRKVRPEVRTANAHLIAASPVLLEALKDAATYLEGLHDNMLENDVDMMIDKNESPRVIADRLRAAIALATGEESK